MFHKDCQPKDADVILKSNFVKYEHMKWEIGYNDSEGR